MTAPRDRKSGQIALVLVFLLLGLVFVLLAEFDVFSAARSKTRLQNAGDAAALAAAAWQGTTLNLVGELNLVRLAAACDPDREAATNAVLGAYALQERLAVAGPCMALLAANAVARENLEPYLPDDDAHKAAHAAMRGMEDIVSYCARAASGRDEDGSRTWPEKNADYADMLRAAISGGCWAGADNAALLPAATVDGAHPLYSRGFYDAAKAGNWPRICINVFGGRHGEAVSTLLHWQGWGTVPEASTAYDWDNPEFFGVGFRRLYAPDAVDGAALDRILSVAGELGLDAARLNKGAILRHDAFHFLGLRWFFLDSGTWRDWTEIDPGGATRFPIRSRVRDEYNYLGAGAACRVVNALVPVSDDARTNLFSWTAAAKPFGSWHGEKPNSFPLTGSGEIRGEGAPDASLAMPLFAMARLIPLGGIGESRLGAADETWLVHVRSHVPSGIRPGNCPYCQILDKWDSPGYTQAGGQYLMTHDHDEVCAPPSPGGGGPGGGTRHAH